MIRVAQNKCNPKYYGKGECFKAVKNSAQTGGVITRYPEGAAAREGVKEFTEEGFINLLDHPEWAEKVRGNPNLAPRGAIMVYSGGTRMCGGKPCGHIEIKTRDAGLGGYASYYCAENPVRIGSGKYPRKLIGVMIKPINDLNVNPNIRYADNKSHDSDRN
jgi:hypothetical protein